MGNSSVAAEPSGYHTGISGAHVGPSGCRMGNSSVSAEPSGCRSRDFEPSEASKVEEGKADPKDPKA